MQEIGLWINLIIDTDYAFFRGCNRNLRGKGKALGSFEKLADPVQIGACPNQGNPIPVNELYIYVSRLYFLRYTTRAHLPMNRNSLLRLTHRDLRYFDMVRRNTFDRHMMVRRIPSHGGTSGENR